MFMTYLYKTTDMMIMMNLPLMPFFLLAIVFLSFFDLLHLNTPLVSSNCVNFTTNTAYTLVMPRIFKRRLSEGCRS